MRKRCETRKSENVALLIVREKNMMAIGYVIFIMILLSYCDRDYINGNG